MRTMLVTALLFVGCGAPTQQGPGAPKSAASPTSAADQDEVQCQDEAPTGTLRRRTVCRDKFEREGEQKNAQDWMKTPRSSPQKGN